MNVPEMSVWLATAPMIVPPLVALRVRAPWWVVATAFLSFPLGLAIGLVSYSMGDRLLMRSKEWGFLHVLLYMLVPLLFLMCSLYIALGISGWIESTWGPR
jgi:hypothetical protein